MPARGRLTNAGDRIPQSRIEPGSMATIHAIFVPIIVLLFMSAGGCARDAGRSPVGEKPPPARQDPPPREDGSAERPLVPQVSTIR